MDRRIEGTRARAGGGACCPAPHWGRCLHMRRGSVASVFPSLQPIRSRGAFGRLTPFESLRAGGSDVRALCELVSSNERKQPPATEPRSEALLENRDRLLSLPPHWRFYPAVRLWAPPVSPHSTPGPPILRLAGEDKEDGGSQAAAPARC